MEGGSLFNSGFLGASFSWWIGQIADDSTWRDNILPGKFESADQIPGWGRRYKVRIIGLHDQGETEIKSEELPWAQVMYPVTGGGGQAKSGGTANLRQGNMVFGFFLDGQDQQVPVIMGVLGNNAQTSLATKIGDGRVTNTQPGSLATSGYAEPAIGTKDPNIRVPDEGLVIKKPVPPGTPSASPKPGVVLDKFGRDPSRSPTRAELNAAQSARAEADRLGLTGAAKEAIIANATTAATRQEASAAASAAAAAVPGATIENVDAVHLQSNADTKRLDLYLKKTVMLSPCDLPGSAMKAMQTDIDNLTKEVDKILQSASFYVDAVSQVTSKVSDIARQVTNAAGDIGGVAGSISNVVGDIGDVAGDIGAAANQVDNIDAEEKIRNLIDKFTPKIAKYMKIVFNKILEFTTKQINKVLGPAADVMFPNQRFQFFDIKIEITEEIKCLFTKIMENLPKQIAGALTDLLLDTGKPPGQQSKLGASQDPPLPTRNNPNPKGGTTPFVPICYVEDLTGDVIAANMGSMNKTSTKIVSSVGAFLNDIQEKQFFNIEQSFNQAQPIETIQDRTDEERDIEDILDLLGGIKDALPAPPSLEGLNVSIVSAFSFENIAMNLFGCDLKPNCPVSDFYTLQEGAGAAEEAEFPRPAQVSEDAKDPTKVIPKVQPPFASPSKDTKPLITPPPGAPPDGGYTKGDFFPPSLYDNSITDALDIF